MRPYGRIIPIGVILTAALLFVAIRAKSQAPAAQVWEYSSVTGDPTNLGGEQTGLNSYTYKGSATICYATPGGCRSEVVTTTGPDAHGPNAQGHNAIMTAAAKLGEQGWELTTSSEVFYESTRARILYFRRLKSDAK